MNNKFLWLDLETTGLEVNKHGIIQLAYIYVENGKILEKGNLKVKPFKTDVIDDGALEVNHTTREQIKGFLEVEVAFKEFIEFLDKYVNKYDKKDKMIIAGYNVGFDVEFLKMWFKKNNFCYFNSYFDYKKYDVLQLAIFLNLNKIIDTKNNKLTTLADYFNIELDAHDAFNDILATYELNNKIKDLLFNVKSGDYEEYIEQRIKYFFKKNKYEEHVDNFLKSKEFENEVNKKLIDSNLKQIKSVLKIIPEDIKKEDSKMVEMYKAGKIKMYKEVLEILKHEDVE